MLNKLLASYHDLLDLFGKPIVWTLSFLARCQLSANPVVRGITYLPFQFFDGLLGVEALRLISHVSFRQRERERRGRIRNRKFRSYLYLAVGRPDKNKTGSLSAERFRAALRQEKLEVKSQFVVAHQLFQSGRLNLACEAFDDLLERWPGKQPIEDRLQLLRDAGTASFMLGKYEAASRYWRMAGELRRFILGAESGPIYRILGNSWFVAIGHVAMLSMYIQYNQLYRTEDSRFVAQTDLSNVPGNYLCERFAKKGIEFLASGRLHADYDRWAKRHGKLRWDQLSATERFALIDEFWEFEFPDGQVFGYTHAAARVQQEWERQGRPPLLSLTSDDRTFLERVLGVLGLPKNAWYVCLHVREPGFHQNWNAVYPSMRDASIEDYLPAIDLIVKRGGWVIRMGDPSMKPLPPLANVVDYAHSSLKTPHADMLISLGCRFFLGTNSGFATVPAIYGVRCVFSNWLPIGLPFWPSHSLMMPKLFWNEQQERFMTLEEIFRTGVAFVQNWSDLPAGVTLRDNSPEEIRDLASEALGLTPEAADEGLEEARTGYSEIAVRYGSYVGSTLAASFIRHHPSLFIRGEDQDLARGEEPISAAQNAEILDSNTTAVGVESDDGLPAVAAVAGGDRVRS